MYTSMSAPLLPPPYDQIGHRPFSFYPAIVNIEHNEWRLQKATWSEFLVGNTKTADEIWIPRRFIGELSRTDEPVMIVGLTRELEFRNGQIVPYVRRVIEMPRAVNDVPQRPGEPAAPAPGGNPVVGIRFESGTERRMGRLIVGAMLAGVLACVLAILLLRNERDPRISYAPVLQTSELGLSGTDDVHDVIRKLGAPAQDSWKSETGSMQYRALRYPDRGITVILMGTERDKALYVGSMDSNWKPVDAVSLPNGRDTYSLLRSLGRF
jgi:hypothetical protein